jgi:hypothetical protein
MDGHGNPLMFSIIFIPFGLIALVFGIKKFRKAKASAKWPKTVGTIVSSDVEITNNRIAQAQIKVIHNYNIDGKTFTSDKVSLLEYKTSNIKRERKRAAKYVPGSTVTVYYNPEKKEEGILELGGVAVPSCLIAILGAFMLLMGLVLLLARLE